LRVRVLYHFYPYSLLGSHSTTIAFLYLPSLPESMVISL
jgi:hypothetical protein